MESFNYLRVPPELLQAVLDNPYEGTIIIDSNLFMESPPMKSSGGIFWM